MQVPSPSTLFRIAAPALVLGLGALVYALLHFAKPEPDKKDEPVRPLSVHVTQAERSSVRLDVATSGEVRPAVAVDIVTQVGGVIAYTSPEFTEGGRVEPDTVLVRIVPTDFELALRQAEARVAEAEVGVQQALADADVARSQLRNTGASSPLARREPQVAEARARLAAASASLQQAQLDLARTAIALPFSGRLTSTRVDVGQYVTPGTVLGRAFAADRVEVRIPFTDAQLASLDLPIGYVAADEGRQVLFSARVAGREQQWRGHLTRLDAAVDPSTRMIYGVAEVADPYGAGVSRHGMPMAVGLYVDVHIAGGQLDDGIVIPRQALRAGNQVYVIDASGHLDIRAVDVTHSSRDDAVIGLGVEAGEKVIVSSIRNPIEGMLLEALTPGESTGTLARTAGDRVGEGS